MLATTLSALLAFAPGEHGVVLAAAGSAASSAAGSATVLIL